VQAASVPRMAADVRTRNMLLILLEALAALVLLWPSSGGPCSRAARAASRRETRIGIDRKNLTQKPQKKQPKPQKDILSNLCFLRFWLFVLRLLR
jgi:hypothetical protein